MRATLKRVVFFYYQLLNYLINSILLTKEYEVSYGF
jgi:hypothetical protein